MDIATFHCLVETQIPGLTGLEISNLDDEYYFWEFRSIPGIKSFSFSSIDTGLFAGWLADVLCQSDTLEHLCLGIKVGAHKFYFKPDATFRGYIDRTLDAMVGKLTKNTYIEAVSTSTPLLALSTLELKGLNVSKLV